MADPYVRQARNSFAVTFGEDVTAGDLVYFDGTNWLKADADDNTKFAEGMATNTWVAGPGRVCTSGIIHDVDAPYTQGDTLYLSATEGEVTAIRPAGANELIQVVGYAKSTKEISVDIQIPHEVTISMQFPYSAHVAPQDRDNDFLGLGLDDTDAEVGCGFMVPQNCVSSSAVVAYLWLSGTGIALDTGDTYTIDASAGVDNETTSATTDGIAAAALTVAANDLARKDVSAAFTTAGLIDPGNYVGVAIKKAAEGSTGDDPIMLGLEITLLVV